LALGRLGVNFTKALWAAFTQPDPKTQNNSQLISVFFALLGSSSTKAARKTLVNLTLSVNFTKIFRAAFLSIFFRRNNTNPTFKKRTLHL